MRCGMDEILKEDQMQEKDTKKIGLRLVRDKIKCPYIRQDSVILFELLLFHQSDDSMGYSC